MSKKQVFCGAEECNSSCPAYGYGSNWNLGCKLIEAKLSSEYAKKEAYEKMKEYYSLKIEGDK